MAKPSGAACNLQCAYCFYLQKQNLYAGSSFRMPEDVLEAYIRQVLEAHQSPQVTVAWQGGEPTLMGLDFFHKSIEYERKYLKPGQFVQNTIQTNGILLDDRWCEFLREHKFLVGLSLDGPKEMHDAYRRDKAGRSVFEKVMRALGLLKQHQVDVNVLTTVNAANADHPLEVYRFLRDNAGIQFIQFIPIVERDRREEMRRGGSIPGQGCLDSSRSSAAVTGNSVTAESVKPQQYGRFLSSIFDEWVRRDVGRIFVNHFDAALASWVGAPPAMCTTAPECGFAMALEHGGDLYSCDHFVEPASYLGNIMETPLIELAVCEKQREFGRSKRDKLPKQCRECDVLFACHGECPKNRFSETANGEPGLNYLCSGLKSFFAHVDRPMQIMAELLRRRRPASEIVQLLQYEKGGANIKVAAPGRNDPCPCGSGLKFKRCHGRE